jgi:8-oxo-dGTP diphosphatase
MAAPEQSIALTADLVGLVDSGGSLGVVMVRRGHPPFVGALALPGGFVDDDEPLEHAAVREMAEETGIAVPSGRVLQIGAFGRPGRDPRGRNVSVAYLALLGDAQGARGADDAAWAGVVGLSGGNLATDEPVAFDHREVLAEALRVAERALARPAEAAVLLGDEATLAETGRWLSLVERARGVASAR